jgi:hypothetical protein
VADVNAPVTVVYVAGYGRTGSTLLDLLLGRVDGWFSVGEFRQFWHARRDDWRCGCGDAIADCPTWSKVVAQLDGTAAEQVIADKRATVRVRRAPQLYARRHGRDARTERLQHTLTAAYAAVADVTGAGVLVDSSKDPLYGLLLCDVPGVRVHVVHLVRDSRAVAWSWQREKSRPEVATAGATLPVHSALHTALEWDLRNALAQLLSRRAASYMRVSYEQLTRAPAETVASIIGAVTPSRDAAALAAAALADDGTEHVNHTVGGNPMRFGATTLAVRPDDEWRHRLPARDRRTVSALTWPLLRAYGYR